ncbi:hypothetical protein V6N12_016834 [Hibiscus sabdariffa]|uniref:Uncharacterized protein n=1 Tax=Hibiscus sabdariffa TaxID=183260 RepID=A0ABR2BQV0_9ROSI
MSARMESPTIRNKKPNIIVETPTWNARAPMARYRQGSIVNRNPQQMVNNSNTMVTTEPVMRNNAGVAVPYLRFIFFIILVLNLSSSMASDLPKRRHMKHREILQWHRTLQWKLQGRQRQIVKDNLADSAQQVQEPSPVQIVLEATQTDLESASPDPAGQN